MDNCYFFELDPETLNTVHKKVCYTVEKAQRGKYLPGYCILSSMRGLQVANGSCFSSGDAVLILGDLSHVPSRRILAHLMDHPT